MYVEHHSVRLSSKGQLIIPSAMRHAAGIEEGSELDIYLNADGSFTLTPRRGSIGDFIGMGKRLGMKPIKDYRRAIGSYLLAEDERTKSRPKKRK